MDFHNAIFVQGIPDIVKLYENRSWKANFGKLDWVVSHEKILKEIENHKGSIGKQTATLFGMQVGKLRNLIINMGIGDEVNTIRKKYNRRPADFTKEIVFYQNWHVFERILPANYE